MHGSCHLDRALNFEIGVEYQMIFVVVVFNDAENTFWDTFKMSNFITKLVQ